MSWALNLIFYNGFQQFPFYRYRYVHTRSPYPVLGHFFVIVYIPFDYLHSIDDCSMPTPKNPTTIVHTGKAIGVNNVDQDNKYG